MFDSSDTPPAGDFPTAQSLLAAIVDSSDDAIVSKDLNGVVTSWNAGAQRMFGYLPEEMVGTPITRLIPYDRLEEEPAILERLRRGERVEHFESIRVRKDGSHFEVSLTISPVKGASGRIVGASKIARDITAQKEALRRLAEANEKLEIAAQMKSEFVATLSHELRTPLMAISGWLHLLRTKVLPAEDFDEGLAVIDRNTRAQAQLIEDLLDMSRIEAGKVRLDLENLDIASVADTALEAVQLSASAKQIHITRAYSSIDAVVMADRNRLQQIIWNLLSNAIKFTSKGGKISVAIDMIDSCAEITISDNGEGIAPEFLPHVFERFRQADGSTTRRHGGLGLGLSIVKHLVELHGGEVRARSRGEGKGASFVVSMPLAAAQDHPARGMPADRRAEAGVAALRADLRGIKVLSIDDDPDAGSVIRRILQADNAEVRVASSVKEALATLDSFRPDVILSDIGMPGEDGYDFIRLLRAKPNGGGIPAVALTALARSEDRTRALRAGFQMHVAKPVEAEELVAVIKNLSNLRTKSE